MNRSSSPIPLDSRYNLSPSNHAYELDRPKKRPYSIEYAPISEDRETSAHDGSLQPPKPRGLLAMPRWRRSVALGALVGVIVLLINLIFLLWAEARNGFPGFDPDANPGSTLFEGSCTTSKRLNIGAHILINILSTALLGASNYCMQIMSAPNREDINRYHARTTWLDIGIPSFRNIRHIGGKRRMLWMLLAVSSLPIHLLYNSTVYASVAGNEYYAFAANSAFGLGTARNYTTLGVEAAGSKGTLKERQAQADYMVDLVKSQRLIRLTTSECLASYGQSFQTRHGNVILVAPESDTRFASEGVNAVLSMEVLQELGSADPTNQCPPFNWICRQDGEGCFENPCSLRIAPYRADPTEWRPFGTSVDYCLAEKIEGKCRLNYSLHLLVPVLLLNLFKILIMAYIAFRWQGGTPLLTVGDAVASFVEQSDTRTAGMCFMSMTDFVAIPAGGLWTEGANRHKRAKRRYWAAARRSRWGWTLFIMAFAVIAIIPFMIWGVMSSMVGQPLSYFLGLGIGAVTPETFIRFPYAWAFEASLNVTLIRSVLIANAPQVILSMVYFAYNGLFTCLSLTTEWISYGQSAKGLRISGTPRNQQRSTYFLQLPYRLAVPLMIVSIVMHWLVSQSIFLVSVDAYMVWGRFTRTNVRSQNYRTVGFSPAAMLAVIIMGSLMFIAAVVAGAWRFDTDVPIAGSCSAAISASCHPPAHSGEEPLSTLRLRWGAVKRDGQSEYEHCTFAEGDAVSPPQEGVLYQ